MIITHDYHWLLFHAFIFEKKYRHYCRSEIEDCCNTIMMLFRNAKYFIYH